MFLTRVCGARPKPVRNKQLFRLALVYFGIALLLAALFFAGESAAPVQAQTAGTPTPDRLAQPTLPAAPSQADHGAQVYWLRCLTCHGDRGQGLTDEFRQTYPPDHQNCWTSKCHGDHPYQDGFTLPPAVPAVIGPGALQKFPNANSLHAFIAAAMPFWKPGSLSEEEAWSVTAFLLRENGLWDGSGELGAGNAEAVRVGPPSQPTVTATPAGSNVSQWPLVAGGVVLAVVILGLVVWVRRWMKQ